MQGEQAIKKGRDHGWLNKTWRLVWNGWTQLIKEINHHNYLYYTLDKPEISDAEYDQLYDELVALERETGVVLPNSPTQRVGGRAAGGIRAASPSGPPVEFGQGADRWMICTPGTIV